MPIYAMQCRCGHAEDIFRTVAKMNHEIPLHCGKPMQRRITVPMIMPDAAAYRAVAIDKKTGKAPTIEGRAQHREFLKRNGYVEVGNDVPTKRTLQGDFNVRKELNEVTKKAMSGTLGLS